MAKIYEAYIMDQTSPYQCLLHIIIIIIIIIVKHNNIRIAASVRWITGEEITM